MAALSFWSRAPTGSATPAAKAAKAAPPAPPAPPAEASHGQFVRSPAPPRFTNYVGAQPRKYVAQGGRPMARGRSIWNRRSGGVKAYRHVVGLGAAAGAFLAAAVTPLTTAPTANAGIVDPAINTVGSLSVFEPRPGGDGAGA